MANDGGEVLLPGGLTNAGLVTRLGRTVRRPRRPTSPATWALLEHLERVGFDGAPRFLGIDDRGREMLSFIPGQAAIEPHQDWALTDATLISVAELLRRYHDAVASFDATGHSWPEFVPPAFQAGIISHNDPNLDNIIFADGIAVALIDFDLASPGSATWDVACAARLWAPLRDPRDTPRSCRAAHWTACGSSSTPTAYPTTTEHGSSTPPSTPTTSATTSCAPPSATATPASAACGKTAANNAPSEPATGSPPTTTRCEQCCGLGSATAASVMPFSVGESRQRQAVIAGGAVTPPRTTSEAPPPPAEWRGPENMTDGPRTGQVLTVEAPAPRVGWP
jgi:hypothetical protein